MRRVLIAAILAITASMAGAETAPLTAPEFEAEVTGYTLRFSAFGHPYGAEQYLSQRRVIWSFSGGVCRQGTWSEPKPGQICFDYEGSGEAPQCWAFHKEGGKLWAKYLGPTELPPLQEVSRSPAGLDCQGPEVGA